MASVESQTLCCFCRLPRAALRCEVCDEPVCRSCVERLDTSILALLESKPAALMHLHYCPRCYGDQVEPAVASYNETLERAKNVGFWPKAYRGHVPIINAAKGARPEWLMAEGPDRDGVVLKLGFEAARRGFNGLVRGELSSRKVRTNGYQTTLWSARAQAVNVDEGKLERSEFREAHWRVLSHR